MKLSVLHVTSEGEGSVSLALIPSRLIIIPAHSAAEEQEGTWNGPGTKSGPGILLDMPWCPVEEGADSCRGLSAQPGTE